MPVTTYSGTEVPDYNRPIFDTVVDKRHYAVTEFYSNLPDAEKERFKPPSGIAQYGKRMRFA